MGKKEKKVVLAREDVLRVAKLANLSLSEEEIEKFRGQLSRVLDYVSQLAEVETKGVEPTSQTTGLVNRSEADEVRESESLSQEEAISGAGRSHNGLFVVPGILNRQ